MRLFHVSSEIHNERAALEAEIKENPEQAEKLAKEHGFMPYKVVEHEVNGEKRSTQLFYRGMRAKCVYIFSDGNGGENRVKSYIRLVYADFNPTGNSPMTKSLRESVGSGKIQPYHVGFLWAEGVVGHDRRVWLAKTDWRFGSELIGKGRWFEVVKEGDSKVVYISSKHMVCPEGYTGVAWDKPVKTVKKTAKKTVKSAKKRAPRRSSK